MWCIVGCCLSLHGHHAQGRWCRAKERILAHGKEQHLDIPVTVTERGSVAVEDVASMLDTVLINSSNNTDQLCELQEALVSAREDARALREDLAAWQAIPPRGSPQTHTRWQAVKAEVQSLQVALNAALAEHAQGSAGACSLARGSGTQSGLHRSHAQCDEGRPAAAAEISGDFKETASCQGRAGGCCGTTFQTTCTWLRMLRRR